MLAGRRYGPALQTRGSATRCSVGFTTAAIAVVIVVVVVVVVVLAATVDSEASNAVLPPLHPVDRNRTKYSLSRPAGQRAACLARTYLYDLAGPYIGASAKQTRSGIRARVRRQSASRSVCERRKIAQGVFCERGAQLFVSVRVRRRAGLARTSQEELQQFRKATTMIVVEGNRLQPLKIRSTMPNVEEELANAPAGQKLFRFRY